jgi:hypothetical protein
MPGIAALGKLFFEKISLTAPAAIRGTPRAHVPLLIVGKIIRLKLRRGSAHLVALNEHAAVTPRREFALVRVRRDNPSAAGGRAVNQSSIGGNANHSSAR